MVLSAGDREGSGAYRKKLTMEASIRQEQRRSDCNIGMGTYRIRVNRVRRTLLRRSNMEFTKEEKRYMLLLLQTSIVKGKEKQEWKEKLLSKLIGVVALCVDG